MNPVKTLCFTLSLVALLAASVVAQTRTVYFYPPDDGKWISGRSYISNGQTATALKLDPATGCGWYKAEFSGGTNPPAYSQFWLGSNGVDRIGPNGRMAVDFEEEVNASNFTSVGGVFQLSAKFTSLNTNNIYFVADEVDKDDPNAGWYSGNVPDVTDNSRCEFKLAAFIYDTDRSKNPSFTLVDEDIGAGQDQYGKWTSGIIKGMVKPRLTVNPDGSKKLECDKCTGKPGAFNNTTEFENAFKTFARGDKNATNAKVCYDMPFGQVANGSFEFDSDKMRNNGRKLVGGFFPEVLDKKAMREAAVVPGASDYNDCPACANRSTAESFVNLTKKINPWCFERGRQTGTSTTCTGPINTCCGAEYGQVPGADGSLGHFAHGGYPKDTWGMTVPSNQNDNGNVADWRWSWRDSTINLWDDNSERGADCGKARSDEGKPAPCKANEYFCFESHAKFMYDPEQEFFFRGDDDIWIYIDNRLVIDLGGSHLAAPGYVKLSEMTNPALESGKEYDIDIYFCDRRTTMSNIRVSTNMYIAQKSAFTQDPENTQNVMCAAITGGADCASKMSNSRGDGEMCGSQLTDGGYVVDFYMINRVTKDTVYLSPARGNQTRYPQCVGGEKEFKCNGDNGIVVNNAVYKCGGKGKCKGDQDATAKVGIQGSYNVYARLMRDGKPVEGAKVLLIDSFKGESNDRIVWGQMRGDNGTDLGTLKDAYGNNAVQRQDVVAGKWIPVYISTGRWAGDNAFEFDDDPEVAGHKYSLSVSGGKGLTIYDKGRNPIGTTSASGTLPASGVDTLWVKADYDIGEVSFSLNVTGDGPTSPSMIINIKQPQLQFRAEDGSTVNPSGWAKWGAGGKPPVVGNPLDVYIVAWDPVANSLCDHCNFTLTQKSESVGTCKTGIANPIVRGDKLSIENGKLNTYMRGQDDTGADGCTATWKIYGESPENTNTQWTLLRFRESPVPVPLENYIYDRNGDGIGDKVEIIFNKSLTSKGDSLFPILLEVNWDGTPHYFYYSSNSSVDQLKSIDHVKSLYKDRAFLSANAAYWKNSGFLKNDSTIIIEKPDDIKFSERILTSGTGKVSAYIPYIDTECPRDCNVDNAFSYSTSPYDLKDRIPPIVVKAEYVYASSNKGGCEDGGIGCKETFTVQLSEPVFAGPDASEDLVKNPFSYCLGHSQGPNSCLTTKISESDRFSQSYNNTNWDWELPRAESYASNATYKPSRTSNAMLQPGAAKGDSVVELIYFAKKLDNGSSMRSPKADDWVKLRGDAKVFQDAQGNVFSPRERGVLITGTNPSKKRPIQISQVNPKDPKGPINGTFDGSRDPAVEKVPDWIGREGMEYGKNNLFKPGNVTEVLPVPKHITNPKDVMQYYPSSVGTLFDIADNFRNEVGKLLDTNYYADPAGTIQLNSSNIAEYVKVKASAYYHTNLGNYTAHREDLTANCTDAIFRNAEDAGNCYTNEYNYYLAWDLKDNKNRFVGSGAYVGISKFWLEVKYYEKKANGSMSGKKTKKLSEQEFIEMFGVKRTGSK